MTGTYQLLPPLTDQELADLTASIHDHGVLVPVIIDEDGQVIDGHHRQKIADHLGIDYPVIQRTDLGEAEKRTLALGLNLHRRHLTREQKRQLVEASLAADPSLSNRQHAERTGTSHPTVAGVRADLESTGKIYQSETRTGADGRERPATVTRKETETRTSESTTTFDAATGKILTDSPTEAPAPAADEPVDDEGPGSDAATTAAPGPSPHAPDSPQLAARRLAENASKAAHRVRRDLLTVDPDDLIATADELDRDSYRRLAADLRAWCDRLDAALAPNLRSVQ